MAPQATTPPVRRRGGPTKGDQREAQILEALRANAPLDVDVSADANGTIVGKSVRRNPDTGGARVELRFKRNDDTKPTELRAALRSGTTGSETWSYAFPPG